MNYTSLLKDAKKHGFAVILAVLFILNSLSQQKERKEQALLLNKNQLAHIDELRRQSEANVIIITEQQKIINNLNTELNNIGVSLRELSKEIQELKLELRYGGKLNEKNN